MRKIVVYDYSSGYAQNFKKNLNDKFIFIILKKEISIELLNELPNEYFLAIIVISTINDYDKVEVLKTKAFKTIICLDRNIFPKEYYDRKITTIDLLQSKKEILSSIENVVINNWNKYKE